MNITPHYAQSTEFSCGAACLLMGFKILNPSYNYSRIEEIKVWKEATTVFMTTEHGGCGPHGLAVAALNRGCHVEIYTSPGILFESSVRDDNKKSVIKLVQEDFEKELTSRNINIYPKANLGDLKSILLRDGVPIVLISTYLLDGYKSPHWIVVLKIEGDQVWIHDPYVEEGKERINYQIPVADFLKMTSYGSEKISATVALYKKP